MQLDIYNSYNKMLRQLHDEGHVARVAETEDRIKEIVAERTQYLNAAEGESLTTDDMQDVYIQAKAEEREKYNFSLNTKGKTGDITDYLETRRPFGAAQWEEEYLSAEKRDI